MISAGMLRDLVSLQGSSQVDDGQGGYEQVWSEKGKVWANITGLSGAEAMNALVERSSARWRVIIRVRQDVATKDRLVWGARVLDIISVLPWPEAPRAALLLLCESEA